MSEEQTRDPGLPDIALQGLSDEALLIGADGVVALNVAYGLVSCAQIVDELAKRFKAKLQAEKGEPL